MQINSIELPVVYISLLRPLNCAITFISVLVGSWVGKEIEISSSIIIAGTIGFSVCAFGNIVNDIFDIEIDRINCPNRPLPSGRVKKETAIIMALAFLLFATVLTFKLKFYPAMIVALASSLLFLYAIFFKRTPFANLIVGLVAGLSFIFGGFITENYYSLFPFFFAILIHLAREIVKDVIDIKGDQAFKINSLPILLGPEKALRIAGIVLVLLLAIIPLPFILRILNLRYLLISIIGAYPLIIWTIIKLFRASADYHLQSNLLKFVMGIGLVGFIFG